MVIQHNLASIFTQRELKTITGQKSKSTEKLSSGYRINRSADDAAGLAISEKMRWQIRGLDKGADNISEGISLLQTGEGALNEVHAILQRVRELHVQALNDTNTEEDRHDIQAEVDASLKEIDRIRESTMFNTKPILQGNPYEMIQVSEDQEVEYMVSQTLKKEAPNWLKIDEKMALNNYNITQDTGDSEIMRIVKKEDDGTITKKYYGKEGALPESEWGHTQGEWTETANDNYSAKFDFSGLLDSKTAVELYTNVFHLMGTKISFPCGTCSEFVNSIEFGGSENGMEIGSFKANPGVVTDASGTLNLSTTRFKGKNEGYFAPISKLISDFGKNYDKKASAESQDPEGEKTAVQNLAREIAADLTTKCIGILGEKMGRHFDRVTAVSGDPYSFVVYDFRDKGKINYAESPITKSAEVNIRSSSKYVQPGEKVWADVGFNIMCGSLKSSYIKLNLPDLSLDNLNLRNYNVDYYDVTERYKDSGLQKQYEEAIKAWEQDVHYEQRTGTRKVTEIIEPAIPGIYTQGYDENGEKNGIIVAQEPVPAKTKTHEEPYTYYVGVRGPKPAPPQGETEIVKRYAPSSLNLMDEAIDQVSKMRVLLGTQQNRLEYAYNINNNTSENTQAAESRVRDTDMAKEMVSYSKSNILAQAAQSMLTQTNQQPQGILALLQ